MYKSIILFIIFHNVFGEHYNNEVLKNDLKKKLPSLFQEFPSSNTGQDIPPLELKSDFIPKTFCQQFQDYHHSFEYPLNVPLSYLLKERYNYMKKYKKPVHKLIANPIYINKPPIHKIIKQPLFIEQKYHISKIPIIHEKHTFEIKKEKPITGSVEKKFYKKEGNIDELTQEKDNDFLKKEKYNEDTDEKLEIDERKLNKKLKDR